MFFFLYSLLLSILWPLYFVLALVHPKLREFRQSRKEGKQTLKNFLKKYKKKYQEEYTGRDSKIQFPTEKASQTGSAPPIYWLHGASVGEIDQALALARSIRKHEPGAVILLSAFSLSVRPREIEGIDLFFYMPLDFPRNWRQIWKGMPLPRAFVSMTWDVFPNLLSYLHKHFVSTYLCSASLSEKSWRLRFPWRGLLRPVYACLSGIGTVDEKNQKHFAKLHPNPARVQSTGDSRFDTIFYKIENLPLQPDYAAWLSSLKQPSQKTDAENRLLILASTYRIEEEIFIFALPSLLAKYPDLQVLLFPHKVDAAHISQIELLFQTANLPYLKYSRIRSALEAASSTSKAGGKSRNASPASSKTGGKFADTKTGSLPPQSPESDFLPGRAKAAELRMEAEGSLGSVPGNNAPQEIRVFLMDCVGLLALSYAYSSLCYVGGGFGKRVHNVAEPAALGNAILTGPNIDWSGIALALEQEGSLVRSHDAKELLSNLKALLSMPEPTRKLGRKARLFLENERGASDRFYETFIG